MRFVVDSTLRRMIAESTFAWIGLILALAVLAWLIVRFRNWFREDEDPAEPIHEMLTQARELHQEGHLSEEEFRSIRRRLGEQMDQSSPDDAP